MDRFYLRADAVKAWAARRNLTLEELADWVGVALGHLHALMRGKFEPSPRTRRRFSERLGLRFDELFEVRSRD
jgi:transcriptional regulator with XRE-family HTH domain